MIEKEDNVDFDRHFKILTAGTERTRGILYFLCLALTVGVISFLSDHFDSAGNRLKIINAATSCSIKPTAADQPVPLKNFEDDRTCGFFTDYVEDSYNIRVDGTDESKKLLSEKRSLILKQYEEGDTINIPFLNNKIDVNIGLLFQNAMAILILCILFLSLRSELRCLNNIIRFVKGEHWRARAISDSHVFLGTSPWSVVLWTMVFLPGILQFKRLFDDFGSSAAVMGLYGKKEGFLFYSLEVMSEIIVFVVATACFIVACTIRNRLIELKGPAKL
jgi:hypothetical protein